MWRPKDWEPCTIDNLTNYEHLTYAQCYEAGADAMLEALKKRGIKATNIRDLRYPESDVLTFPTIDRMKEMTEVEGVWVFVPEEEE